MNLPDLYQTFKLMKKHPENYRTLTLVFDHPLHQAQPGQFVMVWLPDVGEKPYSIAGDDPFSLTVTAVGQFSETLCNLQSGGRIWVRGPLGHGFRISGKRHLIVGGGYGAAPLFFLAKKAFERGDAVQVCLGARSSGDLLLLNAFKTVGCDVKVATDDGSLDQRGLVTNAAADVLADFNPDTLYACGPLPMLTALAYWCKEKRLPAQLSWEALMRCGIGLCGSCELDEDIRQSANLPIGWLTCKDGPVSFSIL